MADKYILLADGTAVPEPDLMAWARWFEAAGNSRTLVYEKLPECGADVSTVFLGLDHSFGQGPPLIWETLVFGGALDQEMARYATRDEAIVGHVRMVERVRTASRLPNEVTP